MVLSLDPNFSRSPTLSLQRARRSSSRDSSSSSSTNSDFSSTSSTPPPTCSPPSPENRHTHYGYFCPASQFPNCYCYKCNIHGCTCSGLITTSALIILALGLAFLGIAANAIWIQFKPDEEMRIAESSKKVSHILRMYDNQPEEIRRQLQKLHYGGMGYCKWKESANCKGLPNLASQAFGASIVSTFDTIPYRWRKFSNDAYENDSDSCGAQNMLKNSVIPGRSFMFVGEGRVLIQLGGPALISGFTLNRPHADLMPIGSLSAAPKDFEVLGHYNIGYTSYSFQFGNFLYKNDGRPAQAFPIRKFLDIPIDLIEVHFKTNHGNTQYTSVYTFEIHGDIGRLPQ